MQLLGFIGSQEIVLVLIVSLVMFVIPIIALIDILRNDFEGNNKIIWVIVILLTWLLGAILYYFIGRKQKIEK
ncbi:MAG: PLD nuclease N-terminal domain-containing protein [Tangfeifania sp.]